MSVKHQKGLHFIIAGDTNELKLDAIIQLSSQMKQVVTDFTMMNPPRILDPIITTLSKYYQKPLVLPPLDQDPDKNGKPSNHKIVKMKPINTLENITARNKRQVTLCPIPKSGVTNLLQWADNQIWENVLNVKSTHQKAKNLQDTLMEATNKFLPLKTVNFSSDDSPWVTPQIKTTIRKRQREYRKHRRSDKWAILDIKVKDLVKNVKAKYYKNVVQKLKESNDGQWYSKLKNMSRFDQHLQEPIILSEISEHSDQEQAELIADKFSHSFHHIPFHTLHNKKLKQQ